MLGVIELDRELFKLKLMKTNLGSTISLVRLTGLVNYFVENKLSEKLDG